MTRAKQNIVAVLKSSAGVGAWAGGIYGLLVGSWGRSVFGAGEMPIVIPSLLQTFVLACLAGVMTGAITGAIVGAVMGFGIYDLLKHEQDAQEVDRLFMNKAQWDRMHRRQFAVPWGANGSGVDRQRVESSRAFEQDC